MVTLAAQSTDNSTAAWFTLVGALGGVALTSIVGIVTAALNHRWQSTSTEAQLKREREKALRQERREAYANYWLADQRHVYSLSRIYMKLNSPSNDQKEIPEELRTEELETDLAWREAYATLLLIAGEDTVSAASSHFESVNDLAAKAYNGGWVSEDHSLHKFNRELRHAMRAEILWRTDQ